MEDFFTHKAFPKYSADCLHFIYVFLSLSRFIFEICLLKQNTPWPEINTPLLVSGYWMPLKRPRLNANGRKKYYRYDKEDFSLFTNPGIITIFALKFNDFINITIILSKLEGILTILCRIMNNDRIDGVTVRYLGHSITRFYRGLSRAFLAAAYWALFMTCFQSFIG